jgi:hypothetical protein
LYNRSAGYSFDLSGWRLNGVDYTFPAGTILTNGGFLVLAKNREAFASAYGAGIPVLGVFDGQLDDGGETLTLLRPTGTSGESLVVNRVTYDDDPPWPASADGQGSSLQLIDPRQDNARVSNWSDGSGWRLFTYTGNVGSATLTRLSFFFEVTGGDVYLDDISLVIGTEAGVGNNVLANPGFETDLAPWVKSSLGTNSATTSAVAHSGVSSLHLVVAPGAQSLTTFYQDFPALTPSTNYTLSFWFLSGSSGTNLNFRLNSLFRGFANSGAVRSTPGAPNGATALLPPYPSLWISEVQPLNVNTLADAAGEFEPWIELYNSGILPVSLNGVYLANGYSNPLGWPFPSGTVINAGQYLLVWADGEGGESVPASLHTNFRLNPTNGSVVLARQLGDAPQILDYLNYAGIAPGQSVGSFPAGTVGPRETFFYPTPGRTNNPAPPPVPLFINEWMAANTGIVADPADGEFDDWFEIYNPGVSAVDLTGYRLTDDLANRNKFEVPAGIRIPAGGYLLVWADENAGQTRTNGDLHVNFRLSQSGEAIALYDPQGRLIDAITFGAQTANVSQGRIPNGGPPPFVFMSTPTPRAGNVATTSAPEMGQAELLPGNLIRLNWTAEPGRIYRVQYKTSLGSVSWTDLPGDVTATSTTATRTDAVTGAQRFYRVQQMP